MTSITRTKRTSSRGPVNKLWLGYAQPLDKMVEDPRSAPFHQRLPGRHPGDTLLVERLRMVSLENSDESNFSHDPVMLDEVVELISGAPAGLCIDMTLGGAGHGAAVLDANPDLSLLGIDRDTAAVAKATKVLARFGNRARVVHATFDEVADLVDEHFPGVPVTAVLFDLGVSSHQLDEASRGFSFRNNGPLDMRMDTSRGITAADIVNTYSIGDLTNILREGGESRFAGRIARAIVGARPFENTTELAEVVRAATPGFARRRPGDPARRSFQALRLEVNKELDLLPRALDAALDLLSAGGRCVVLSYHSGEDRMVKETFAELTHPCSCPPALPCVCGASPRARSLTRKSWRASEREQAINPRSESARLRAVEIATEPKAKASGVTFGEDK